MIRLLIEDVSAITIWVWLFSSLAADFTGGWHKENLAARINHWVCFPTIVLWVVGYVADPPPWWLAIFTLPFPLVWWANHKRNHNHKKTRRMLEAGRGLVQRLHNRLVVVPEPATN